MDKQSIVIVHPVKSQTRNSIVVYAKVSTIALENVNVVIGLITSQIVLSRF